MQHYPYFHLFSGKWQNVILKATHIFVLYILRMFLIEGSVYLRPMLYSWMKWSWLIRNMIFFKCVLNYREVSSTLVRVSHFYMEILTKYLVYCSFNCICVSAHMWKSEDKLWDQISQSTTWAWEIKLGSSGLVVTNSTHWSSTHFHFIWFWLQGNTGFLGHIGKYPFPSILWNYFRNFGVL